MSDKCPKCGADYKVFRSTDDDGHGIPGWFCGSTSRHKGRDELRSQTCRIRELESTVAERDATIAGLREESRLWERLARATPGYFAIFGERAVSIREKKSTAFDEDADAVIFESPIDAMRQIEAWEKENAT